MRLFFALFGFALLTAAVPAPKPVPVTRTASGTYVLGSPAARVKLVEYASYTCSHCADFSTQSQAVLKGKMIASGSTSLEFRHMIRDRLDLAAAVLARCTGPRGFFPTSAAIFAAQPAWLEKGIEFQQVNAARINLYPRPAQLKAYADGAGLTDLVKARGCPPPRSTRASRIRRRSTGSSPSPRRHRPRSIRRVLLHQRQGHAAWRLGPARTRAAHCRRPLISLEYPA
ncbi:thioredoxin domain-containing protein [Sphingomonas sp. Ant20]|uniref:thioredoxin domain-containing protein n=1 Tax=Sphingomonas sp. Ant20 TaxID=104605 RepID=UPI000ADF74F2|nr:thioredoxin domain-containing protein [Sphingomonas sp. Ant20]